MGFLLKLLISPVTAPLNGVVWLAEQVEEKANQELYDPARIQGTLAELEMQLEMDEISEETYLEAEEILLERLKIGREMKARGEL
jgi:hypothetical protein